MLGIGVGGYFYHQNQELKRKLRSLGKKQPVEDICELVPLLPLESRIAEDSGVRGAKDFCWMGLALSEKNPKFCEELKQETNEKLRAEKISSCYQELAFYLEQPSLCEKVESTGYYSKRGCYEKLASDWSDISVCEEIEDQDQATDCVTRYISNKNPQPQVCEKIDSRAIKDECYLAMAFQSPRSGVCESIDKKSQRDLCYMTVAQQNNNPELCEKIQNSKTKSDCQKSVGISE